MIIAYNGNRGEHVSIPAGAAIANGSLLAYVYALLLFKVMLSTLSYNVLCFVLFVVLFVILFMC